MTVTYSLCVCVCVCVCSLSDTAAKRMCHIVICGLSGSTKCFHIISQTVGSSEKVTGYKNVF